MSSYTFRLQGMKQKSFTTEVVQNWKSKLFKLYKSLPFAENIFFQILDSVCALVSCKILLLEHKRFSQHLNEEFMAISIGSSYML